MESFQNMGTNLGEIILAGFLAANVDQPNESFHMILYFLMIHVPTKDQCLIYVTFEKKKLANWSDPVLVPGGRET